MYKRCCLEPTPIIADQIIAGYYNQVYKSVFKETLLIQMPGQGIVKLLKNKKIIRCYTDSQLDGI